MKSEMKKNLGAVLSLAVICSAGFFIFRERYTTNEEIINDKYAQILLNNIPYANERDTEISHSGTYICGNCAVLWYRIEHGKDAKEYYAVE